MTAIKDPTPFGTRAKLNTLYREHTRRVLAGEDPLPIAIEVNLSNFCNQNCGWCISANVRDETHFLDVDAPATASFFADFRRFGGKCVTWSGGGEPTTHSKFASALSLVKAVGLPQGLITHGAFPAALVDPIVTSCSWVRVSIDSAVRERYASRRRTNVAQFDLAIENVKRLAAAGCHVGINMNVADWNQNDVPALYELASQIGAKYLQVRPTLDTPFPQGDTADHLSRQTIEKVLESLTRLAETPTPTRLVVSHDKFADLLRPQFDWGYHGCKSHHTLVVLNCDGDLMVCMYHLFDKRFTLGNIFAQPLEHIWRSYGRRQAVQFCERQLNHRLNGCQVCCKGHEINKVLMTTVPEGPYALLDGSPFI